MADSKGWTKWAEQEPVADEDSFLVVLDEISELVFVHWDGENDCWVNENGNKFNTEEAIAWFEVPYAGDES